MPLLQNQNCNVCRREFEARGAGNDIDDVSQIQPMSENDIAFMNDLFGNVLGRQFEGKAQPVTERRFSEGALFTVDIESLPLAGTFSQELQGWVVRYAITSDAACRGGRFDLCLGKRGSGGQELLITVPPAIRNECKLRVKAVGPVGTDLYISIEIRDGLPKRNFLSEVIVVCPQCERESEETLRTESERRERRAKSLPQIGVLMGIGFLVLFGLLIWACFG